MPKKPPRKKKPAGLARFQDRLLELLAAGKKPREVRKAMLADKTLAEFHPYIETMDDPMLAVAAELIGKWGVKGKPS
ncbi:MAG: hypothetical protein ACAH83_14640 [Alphaproteobacteria bacterium]